jgi:hypothetical protein
MENYSGNEAFSVRSAEAAGDSRKSERSWAEREASDIAVKRERLKVERFRLEAEEAALARREAALRVKLSETADKRFFSEAEREWFERGEDKVFMELADRWRESGSLAADGEDGISAADKVRFIDARLKELADDAGADEERSRLELIRSQYAAE